MLYKKIGQVNQSNRTMVNSSINTKSKVDSVSMSNDQCSIAIASKAKLSGSISEVDHQYYQEIINAKNMEIQRLKEEVKVLKGKKGRKNEVSYEYKGNKTESEQFNRNSLSGKEAYACEKRMVLSSRSPKNNDMKKMVINHKAICNNWLMKNTVCKKLTLNTGGMSCRGSLGNRTIKDSRKSNRNGNNSSNASSCNYNNGSLKITLDKVKTRTMTIMNKLLGQREYDTKAVNH